MKRLFRYVLLGLVAFLAYFLIDAYQPGIPVEALKGKYILDDSNIERIDGMDVHIRTTGSGPHLILLHGVASSLHTWIEWQDALSRHFTVTSIDVPGFGLTGGFPDGEYNVGRYMEFLHALVNHLSADTLFMAGNSFGGYLTWNFSTRNPDKVKKVILLNSGGYPKKFAEHELGFFLSKYKATSWFTQRFTPMRLLKRSLRNSFKDDSKVTPETEQRYYDLLVREGNRNNFSKILRMMPRQQNNIELLRDMKQPTLIMWGDEDKIIHQRNAKNFERDIPNSRLILYNSGHIPMEEDPEITVKDAIDFLKNG